MVVASAEPMQPPAPVIKTRLPESGASNGCRPVLDPDEALRDRKLLQSGEERWVLSGAVKGIVGPDGCSWQRSSRKSLLIALPEYTALAG